MISSKLFKLSAILCFAFLLRIEMYAQESSLGLVGDVVDIPNMFNTGIGEGVNLGDADENYRYGTVDGSAAIVRNEPSLIGPIWLANTEDSRWISENANSNSHGGLHDFFYTFSLAGLDPNTALISGRFSVDNFCQVFLNNIVITEISTIGFKGYTEFTIDDNFIEGDNTIMFQVSNFNMVGKMGLRVEYDTATATVVPEPSVYGLLSGILVFSLIVFNKRKIK